MLRTIVKKVRKSLKSIIYNKLRLFKLCVFFCNLLLIFFTILFIDRSNRFADIADMFISLIVGSSLMLITSMVIIEEGEEALVQRLGRYNITLRPGLNFILPMLDEIVVRDTMRERVRQLDFGLVISKNGIPLQINLYLYWEVINLERAFYEVEDYLDALEKLIKSALQSEIGKIDLEKFYSSQETINRRLLIVVDEGSYNWGIKVTRIAIGDINLARAVLGNTPNTIELKFYNGIDWTAFQYSFNLVVQNEEIDLKIQAIENTDDILMVRVKVPPDVDKVKLYQDLTQTYEIKLESLEAQYRKELTSKDYELKFYQQYTTDLKSLVDKLAVRPVILEINTTAESQAVSETQKNKIEQSGSFGAGYIEQAQNNELVGTQHNYAQSKQDLAEAAKEIQNLLKQLEKSNPTSTTLEQMAVATEAIQQIENNPTLKQRVINAAKNGAVEAIKQTPIGAIVAATIEGWVKTDNQ